MNKTRAALIGLFFMALLFSGCYTVVMIPKAGPAIDAESYIEEYSEAEQPEDEENAQVLNKYYIYGDLWPGYVRFDPFWYSPYWYDYPSWYYWHYSFYDPWYWGYSTYGWRPFYYYPRYYYHWGYYDPYDAYWYGYHRGGYFAHGDGWAGNKRQPFPDRTSIERRGFDSQAVTGSASSGLAKNAGGSRPSSLRVGERMTLDTGGRRAVIGKVRSGTAEGTGAGTTGRRSTVTSVRRGSSGQAKRSASGNSGSSRSRSPSVTRKQSSTSSSGGSSRPAVSRQSSGSGRSVSSPSSGSSRTSVNRGSSSSGSSTKSSGSSRPTVTRKK
ncbi:hypothetical protein JW906_05670 [bacterium]|nr:hypothetical protein [bacterium]